MSRLVCGSTERDRFNEGGFLDCSSQFCHKQPSYLLARLRAFSGSLAQTCCGWRLGLRQPEWKPKSQAPIRNQLPRHRVGK
jgi:hypothetical protein